MQRQNTKTKSVSQNVVVWLLGIIPVWRISTKITENVIKNNHWLFCILPIFSTERLLEEDIENKFR